MSTQPVTSDHPDLLDQLMALCTEDPDGFNRVTAEANRREDAGAYRLDALRECLTEHARGEL